MFPLSSIIRIYIILSIIIMISFFVMLTSVDVILEPLWTMVSIDTEKIYRDLYITVIIMSLMAIIFGIIAIFILDRGVNKYQDFIRRFDQVNQHSNVIRPSILKFPNQDEFGNLGQLLNRFIEKIDYFDQFKTILAKAENEKFMALAQISTDPIIIVDTQTNEPFVSFYNHAFRDFFLKKSVFIDNQGKPQTQYFLLENTPITFLTIKDESHSPFFVEQQLDQLKNNNITWEKKHSLLDITMCDLSGDKKYHMEQIFCIPINNELEKTMSQMLYVFSNPQSIEKEKKVMAESPA